MILEQNKKLLIDRVGPWALQSYARDRWHSLGDNVIIEGALLRAPIEVKLFLLEVYPLEKIKAVWSDRVVMQDEWFHDVNIWVAENVFKESNPEQFVAAELKKSQRSNRKIIFD
jgi:hypothetical protein